MAQWLRPCAPTTGGIDSVPGWGNKIPHPLWCNQRSFFKKERKRKLVVRRNPPSGQGFFILWEKCPEKKIRVPKDLTGCSGPKKDQGWMTVEKRFEKRLVTQWCIPVGTSGPLLHILSCKVAPLLWGSVAQDRMSVNQAVCALR